MRIHFGLVLCVLALGFASIGNVVAASPSFGIDSNCPDGVYPITCGPVKGTVTSINGFTGTVNLSTSLYPSCTTGYCLTATVRPSSVNIVSGGSANWNLTFTHSCNFNQHTHCDWIVTVTGSNSGNTNSTSIFVCYGRFCVT